MRALQFSCVLLLAIIGNLYLENRAVRSDQNDMKDAYASFLNRKIKGAFLIDRIRPETLSVFKTKSGIVGCSILK
mgnify:FL=1